MKKIAIVPLLCTFLMISNGASAQLPQDHSYQVVLRDYISTLDKRDFEIPLEKLEFKNSYYNSTSELYRAWLLVGYDQYEMASSKGLRVKPEYFTLSSIEKNGRVNMNIGRKGWISALETAFWAQLDYPGNPHYNRKAAKLRAFVAASVDMMMEDQLIDKEGGRSDFLGGNLIMWSYAYGAAKDVLPQKVKNAYESALQKMFERIEKWGPKGTHADMDTRATVGMLYTAKYVDKVDLQQRALDYIDRLLDKHFKDPGYIDHGGAYDGDYNGISLYFLNWAAKISGYQPLLNALDKMAKLKAYMTLPEPDGNWISPNHANPSSQDGAANDSWAKYFRNINLAGISDHAKYLIDKNTGANGNAGIHSESRMISQINSMLSSANSDNRSFDNSFAIPSDSKPEVWEHDHWTEANFNYTVMHYDEQLYDEISSASEELKKPPFLRKENFIESFADKILSAKQNGYGTVIFNDRLSWWTGEGDTKGLNGIGGGNISSFWTPETGSVLFGVIRMPRNGGVNFDDWSRWPVHALSGETSSGKAFSSGAQRYPEGDYQVNDGSSQKRVIITGKLSDIYADPSNVLKNTLEYRRAFTINKNNLKVTTSLKQELPGNVNKLYEILPVLLKHEWDQRNREETKIEFKVNGSWKKATTKAVTASAIKLSRFKGAVLVNFDNPREVKLSEKDFRQEPDRKRGYLLRNVMINMLSNNSNSSKPSLTYTIKNEKKYPGNGNEGDDDNDDDNQEDKPESDTTDPAISVSHSPQNPALGQKITLKASAEDEGRGIKDIDVYMERNGEKKRVKTCTDTKNCLVEVGPFSTSSGVEKIRYWAWAVDKAESRNKEQSAVRSLTISAHSRTEANYQPSVEEPEVTESSAEGTLELNGPKVEDQDGDSVYTNVDWRADGQSFAFINYSFDVEADTSVKDFSTYQNNGRLQDQFKPEWTAEGKQAGGYIFDGEDDHIFVPSSDELETMEEFTVEFWMKHDDWGKEWATIVSKPFFKSKWEDPWSLFKIARYSDENRLNFQITVDKSEVMSIRTKSDIPEDEWVHVVGTYDGTDLKIYINGELDNERQVKAPLVQGRGTGIYLGTKWGGAVSSSSAGISDMEAYQGKLDEFRLYRRAASAKQVELQYSQYSEGHSKLSLSEVEAGQKWSASVTPTDTKDYGESVTSNAVTIQGIEEGVEKQVGLSQNYPNPFRSETNIEYTLPEEGETEVSLTVYNILGRKVATLVDDESQEGSKRVTFDASQLGLSSGVYFYQLRMGDETYSKKMTFIK